MAVFKVAEVENASLQCTTLCTLSGTFDFTAAGDWNCVAAVERLPALHYSLDFIFLSFGIMGFISEL